VQAVAGVLRRLRHLAFRRHLAAAEEFLRAVRATQLTGGDSRPRHKAHDRFQALLVSVRVRSQERCVASHLIRIVIPLAGITPVTTLARAHGPPFLNFFRHVPSLDSHLSGVVRFAGHASWVRTLQRWDGRARLDVSVEGAVARAILCRVTRNGCPPWRMHGGGTRSHVYEGRCEVAFASEGASTRRSGVVRALCLSWMLPAWQQITGSHAAVLRLEIDLFRLVCGG